MLARLRQSEEMRAFFIWMWQQNPVLAQGCGERLQALLRPLDALAPAPAADGAGEACAPTRSGARQRGLTLIELVIYIVVVSVAVAGVLAVFVQTTRASADPLIRKQAMAVAESLLEEILAAPYACPPSAACAAVTTANRAATHAVGDYNGFAMAGISAIDGSAIPQLAGYNAAVAVTAQALNGAAGSRIAITVASGGESVTLDGWRGNF